MTEQPVSEEKTKLFLEQYKIYVDSIELVTTRRLEANRFYISVLSALLAVIPFALQQSSSIAVQRIVFSMVGLLGITLCILWIVNVNSYRQLNKIKFAVAYEMEDHLPFSCFKREWEIHKQDPKKYPYNRLAKLELWVPFVLLIPYVLLLLVVVVSFFRPII